VAKSSRTNLVAPHLILTFTAFASTAKSEKSMALAISVK
jgi:hypothetical protein